MRAGKIALLACLLPVAAFAQFQRGKVVMPDATIPPQRVFIERLCPGVGPYQEAVTNKYGEYFLHLAMTSLGVTQGRASNESIQHCFLRARIKGFESEPLDLHDPRVMGNPLLPVLTLRPLGAARSSATTAVLPRAAAKPWDLGTKALAAEQWSDAERLLREVTGAAPAFAPAWTGLGMARQNQQNSAGARQAYRQAIAADATALQPRLFLTRLDLVEQHWADAATNAGAFTLVDSEHRYPEAFLLLGIARYQLQQLDSAEASLREALRLDTRRQLPQAEYFLGAVLAGKGDRAGAAGRLRAYLERTPSAPGAAAVQQQIAELDAAAATPEVTLRAPASLLAPSSFEPEIAATGEAWVPGGRQVLAAVARMKSVPGPETFFLEYARTVAAQTSRFNGQPIAGYAAALTAFTSSVAELTELGERRPDRTVIRLSLAPDARGRTERALALLGWKAVEHNGKPAIEPGDQPADGPRQQIPPALGIDELAMQTALLAGRAFEFEIISDTAALAGGAAWGATLEGFTTLPGGIAEAFIRQPRLAKTYAGLAAMGGATGLAFARRAGLRTLVANHSDALWQFGDTLRVASDRAVVPGGGAAEEAWSRLAGASPRDAMKFFLALLTVDKGRLAAFYAALMRADEPHQKFFTRSVETAHGYYLWYRDSDELREGIAAPNTAWRPEYFRSVPLDDHGGIRYPGGASAWNTASPDQEALLAAARLEQRTGHPMSTESATLFAQHFADWRSLLPTFEALPALGPAEFRALAAFTTAAAGYPHARQQLVMGQWHALVALIVLGRQAGSLDDAAAARAFGDACRGQAGPPALRAIVGSGSNLDDAVADFLRLDAPGRAAFDRVRDLLNAPRLQGAFDPSKVVEALAAAVYAAQLDPKALLINEDRGLLARHIYVAPRQPLFQPAALVASSAPPGTHFTGGFAGFGEVARGLSRVGAEPAAAAPVAAFESSPATLFRADARLVEAHTTVTDERGRYIDGLTAADFSILQNGKAVPIAAFENGAAPISCALLLDTSQSMDTAVAALKSAALHLIGALRPNDSVAVYSLNGGISLLQPFTTDKALATRAVLRVEIGAQTALYDGLVRVNRDLAGRAGRKVVVVFTDGEDNASTLTAATAVLRAKTAGVPIYTVAQGHAVHDAALLKDLSSTSQATGGIAFSIQSSSEIGSVFGKILEDLLHGYLLAFAPPPAEDHEWRPIEVRLRTGRPAKVRSREGYYPR